MAIDKKLHERLTEAVWERLAADVAVGRGMLRSSVEEAVAGVLALHESERQEKPRIDPGVSGGNIPWTPIKKPPQGWEARRAGMAREAAIWSLSPAPDSDTGWVLT